MKKIIVVVLMMLSVPLKAATPYLYVPFTKTQNYPNGAPLPVSYGLLYSGDLTSSVVFTNFAVVYHPTASGSIVTKLFPTLSPWWPVESWSINLGYGGGSGNYVGGPGLSVNLLETVQAELSRGLLAIGSPKATAFGNLIAPNPVQGSLSLNVGPQWTAPLMNNGEVPPLDQLRITTHWYFGLGYKF